MKRFLSKPKIIIPIFAMIVFLMMYFLYGKIGNPPTVALNQDNETISNQIQINNGKDISLSFSKNGKIQSVSVKIGDKVKAGETLATISAPDAEGNIAEAKGALDLAEAKYASLNTEYANTKKQQDLLVESAYKVLLSSSLEGVPSTQDVNVPIISGTYSCDKKGSYIIKPYASGDSDSGYSAYLSGLESGIISIKYDSPVALGDCGLQIKFTHSQSFNSNTVWTINIPNTKSSVYLANKNAYDLAVSTRENMLNNLATEIGMNTGGTSVAKAQIDAARGAYEAVLGAYQNNLIISPVDGVVTFIDSDLKVGQSAVAGKSVINISQ